MDLKVITLEGMDCSHVVQGMGHYQPLVNTVNKPLGSIKGEAFL